MFKRRAFLLCALMQMESPDGVWKGVLAFLRCHCGSIGVLHAYGETMCPGCLVAVIERGVLLDPAAMDHYIEEADRHARALVSQARALCPSKECDAA